VEVFRPILEPNKELTKIEVVDESCGEKFIERQGCLERRHGIRLCREWISGEWGLSWVMELIPAVVVS